MTILSLKNIDKNFGAIQALVDVSFEIKEAETNIELREKLSEEYIKTFWSKSSAKIEDDIADAAKGLF